MLSNPISQGDVIAFLLDPATHGGIAPAHVETHLSHLFLTETRVYKLKKAQDWSVVDYSTLAARKHFCQVEVTLNSKTARSLYIGVRPITFENGKLALGGAGEPVEFVVEMHRFDDGAQLDMMADRGTLTPALLDATADAIAAMHKDARVVRTRDQKDAVERLAQQLASDVARQAPEARDAARMWADACAAEINANAAMLGRRGRHGFVRRCHGDLHLSNICVLDGEPVPFDAIEFSEEIATIDVLYDLAFVLIDLGHRGLADDAARFLSRYCEATRDYAGLALLPLFVSQRAMVRALTAAAKGRDPGSFVREARAVLQSKPEVFAVAVGGLSGTGKTTVARALAAKTGAVHIRSDAVRKHLAGVAPETRLGEAAYGAAQTERVYRRMLVDAGRALRAGTSVVLDATFTDAKVRAAAGDMAGRAGAPFCGVWLDAPLTLRLSRIEGRHGDASDADEAIARRQEAQSVGAIAWQIVDAAKSADTVADGLMAGSRLRAARWRAFSAQA